jgi:dihydrolipoamide dehydrogenase
MPMQKYEVIVIGAGPGGYPCAIRLGQLKKKVLAVESKLLGGLCLNWGCIPTKALSYAAELVDSFEKAKRMGFDVTLNGCDLDKLRNWKDTAVTKLRTGVEYLFKANGVEWKQGRAGIISDHIVEVEHEGTKETFEAENIVIATGTEVISLPGLEFDHKSIIDTDDALEMANIPGKLLVVGAGASGLEMATIYSRLGSKVTVVEILEQILPGMESELCDQLYRIMKKSGIDIRVNSQVKVLTKTEDQVRVSIETDGNIVEDQFNKILVTVGRRPLRAAFESMDLQVDNKGYLRVDECLKTSKKNIYAIGDIIGPPLLAHKATKQGVVVAEMIAGLKDKYDPTAVPSCVFTIPPLSSVGLTEKQAAERGHKVVVGRFPYRGSGKAVSMGELEGLVKIVGNDKGALLGVHILGAESPSLIGEGVLAIDKGMKVSDIADSIHPHPTLTEAVQEAAENFYKKAIQIVNK